MRCPGDAARRGARLICFHRSFCLRVTAGPRLWRVVGSRTEEGRGFPEVLGEQRRRPGPAVDALGRTARAPRNLPRDWSRRTGRRSLHCALRTGWPLSRKHRRVMPTASERLVWGFGDGPRCRCSIHRWESRRGDLLGELPTAHARGDVRQRHRALLRADGGSSRHVDGVDAAHRGRGAMFRAVVQPVQPTA